MLKFIGEPVKLRYREEYSRDHMQLCGDNTIETGQDKERIGKKSGGRFVTILFAILCKTF
jgi:hypothetical protein